MRAVWVLLGRAAPVLWGGEGREVSVWRERRLREGGWRSRRLSAKPRYVGAKHQYLNRMTTCVFVVERKKERLTNPTVLLSFSFSV